MTNGYLNSLKFKLISLVFLGVIPLVLGFFFYVFPVFEEHLIDQRKSEVKASVDIVIGILDKIHADAQINKLDKKKEAEDIQNLFSKLRYNKTDYFFAYDSRGYNMAHGSKPDYVGTPRLDSKDPDGHYYIKDFISFINKEEGGFVSYKFEKNKNEALLDKISYIKFYAPLGWVVGSGVYLKDLQMQVDAVRSKVIFWLTLITALILIFSWYYSNNLSRKISKISNDLFIEADNVAAVAINISKASAILSSSTVEQSAALQETSASIEETSAMISKNAENAKSSMSISVKSQSSVEQGKKIVNEMIQSIQEIAASNLELVKQIEDSNKEIAQIVTVINEIGDKTKVINDIVFQTKLLSFNASVEAARAGEHGKGFAVVAEEVGKLAQMSGNSSKDITELLGSSIQTVKTTIDNSKNKISIIVINGEEKVKRGALMAKRCGEIFDEIVINVNQVNLMVGEIASASDEQATGVREITSAVSGLDTVGHENSAMSQRTAEYAEQLRDQVVALKKNTSSLNTMIKGVEVKNQAS